MNGVRLWWASCVGQILLDLPNGEFFLMAWELFVSSSSVSPFWPCRNGVVSQMAGGECLLWWFSWLWWCTSWCRSPAGWAALSRGTMSIVDHFVESFPVHIGAATVPGGGAPGVHRLNYCSIKGPLQLWRSYISSAVWGVMGAALPSCAGGRGWRSTF